MSALFAFWFARHGRALTGVSRPDSGKCIAEQQVHREVESEESCKQISGPTDRNHI